MTQRMSAYAYRQGRTTHRKNDDPEHKLQVAVATYLKWALPDDVLSTASMAGARMGHTTRAKARAAGQTRGWPDIMLMPTDGVCRFIELKAPDNGTLTAEQRGFRDHCARSNRMVWALARSLEEVERALIAFGITPRVSWRHANRYDIIRDA
jgi:hypothetical protein